MCDTREIGPGESHLAWRAMRELRPHVTSAPEMARRVDEEQRPEGFRLAGCFVDGEAEAVAVAGFRVTYNLALGRNLYVDDLVTHEPFRGQGHAGHLMDWLSEEARRLGCAVLHLDSNVGPERRAAHSFYFGRGMRITSYHFGIGLANGT